MLASCSTFSVDETLLLQPMRSVTPQTFARLGLDGFTLEEHFFESDDGTQLHGWFVSRPDRAPGHEQPTVVLFGGVGFYLVHSTQFLELYAALDVDAFLWDYRGYGLSDGTATLPVMKADALSVIDFVEQGLGVSGPIVAHGHSIGTFVASYAAEHRGLRALVLESPVSNAEHWLRSAVPGVVRRLVRVEVMNGLAEADNTARLADFPGPTFLAVGSEDFVTPPAMAEMLYELNGAGWKRLYIQVDGDHNSLPGDDGFRDGFRALLSAVRG